MLECIGSHIKTLGYFVRENTIQTAVSAIELEAEELCEALQKMEGNIVQCLATDVDLQSWQDEIRRFSVSMDRVATPASLRETFCKISDTLSRVDDAISYPSEEFLKEIYTMLLKIYDKKVKRKIIREYNLWKGQHSRRLLAKKLRDKIGDEKQRLATNIGEDSFSEVFDSENDEVDTDGVARYLLSGRFGKQHGFIHEGLDFNSEECVHIYRFIILFEHLRSDLHKEEQEKKLRPKKKVAVEEEVYKYPRKLSMLPSHLQGKLNIFDDEHFAKLADLFNQKVLVYIRQQDNKQLWDVVKSILQLKGLLPKRFSREKFAQLVVFLCPDSGDAKKLQYCMEKNSMTSREQEQANKPFLDMLKPLF